MSVKSVSSLSELQDIIKNNDKVFIDLYANWCGPCRAIAPYVESLAGSNADIIFCKVDIDVASDVAEEFRVSSIPQFIGFKDGKQVGEGKGGSQGIVDGVVAKIK